MARLATATAIAIPDDFPHTGVLTPDAKQAMFRRFYHSPMKLESDGSIEPSVQARYFISKASAAALALAAPIVGDDDNTEIEIVSTTNFAHVLTATGILLNGSSSVNKATMAARAGASIQLVAYQGKWYVLGANQITFG